MFQKPLWIWFVQFQAQDEKEGCWERKIWEGTSCRDSIHFQMWTPHQCILRTSEVLYNSLSPGLSFSLCQLDTEHGRAAQKKAFKNIYFFTVLLKIIWLIFSLLEDLLIKMCQICYCLLIPLTSESLWFMIFFFIFHSQLYRYKYF